MTKQEAEALFLLAGFKIVELYKLANEYYPDNGKFLEERDRDPWWLGVTDGGGRIKIGWRKRVINIDWEGTHFRGELHTDDVTKGDTYTHAYGHIAALKYLTDLKGRLAALKFQKDVASLVIPGAVKA